MNLEVSKASDLLPKTQYEALTPTEMKAYNASATKFINEFNKQYPDGKHVKVAIKQIRTSDRGLAIIVAPHNDLSTTTINLPWSIGDILADNAGVNKAEALPLLVRSSLTPIFLTQTVRAVNVSDTYNKNGVEVNFASPTMTKVTGTYEGLELSNDAAAIVSEFSREGLKNIIMGTDNKRPGVATAAVRPAVVEEDATV